MRFYTGPLDSFEHKPIYWLQHYSSMVEEGKLFLTNFKGNYYLVKKNSNLTIETANTLSRSMDMSKPEIAVSDFATFLKRKRTLEETIDPEIPKIKRKKIDEMASIY